MNILKNEKSNQFLSFQNYKNRPKMLPKWQQLMAFLSILLHLVALFRTLFKERDFSTKNEYHVMNLVYEKHEISKLKVFKMLKSLKNDNDKFSLTLDEWKSKRKRDI